MNDLNISGPLTQVGEERGGISPRSAKTELQKTERLAKDKRVLQDSKGTTH